MSQPPLTSKKARNVALASYIGTTIEWYDFFIYGIAATLVFRTQFFPEFSELGGTLASLGTFAVGFIARPLGGVLMGHFGDRVGRKSMLVVSLLTMGIATTLVGVIPTFAQIGIWAPILLVVLRLAQGVGVGGEWGGAVLMAVEHAPPKRRSLYGSFPQLGVPSGIFLSQLVFLAMAGTLAPGAFASWGWRIPFLLSAVLIVVGLVIRLRIEESADFERVRKAGRLERMPLVEVFRQAPLKLLVGGFASVASPTIGYLVSVYAISYGTTTLGVSTPTMLWILVAVSIPWTATVLIAGIAGDRLGRRGTFLTGAGFAVLMSFPMFWLMDTGTVAGIFAGLLVITVAGSIMAGPQAALISEMFPVRVRYSGASLCYQFGSVLGGGVAPLAATALFAEFGTSMAVSAILATVSVISLLAIALAGAPLLRPVDVETPATEPAT